MLSPIPSSAVTLHSGLSTDIHSSSWPDAITATDQHVSYLVNLAVGTKADGYAQIGVTHHGMTGDDGLPSAQSSSAQSLFSSSSGKSTRSCRYSRDTDLKCSFLSSRRRRRAGRQPMYGTGWSQFGHGQAQYNPNYQASQAAPPPAYNQDHGGYYGQNQGYFGGRQTDVELQPPQNTYGGGDGFAPPSGPPPAKK